MSKIPPPVRFRVLSLLLRNGTLQRTPIKINRWTFQKRFQPTHMTYSIQQKCRILYHNWSKAVHGNKGFYQHKWRIRNRKQSWYSLTLSWLIQWIASSPQITQTIPCKPQQLHLCYFFTIVSQTNRKREYCALFTSRNQNTC